jgi:hypothetical protein
VSEIFFNGLNTSHMVARELLSKPDEFITVTVGNREYSISHTKMIKTHANVDDGVMHKTLVCEELEGNIVR